MQTFQFPVMKVSVMALRLLERVTFTSGLLSANVTTGRFLSGAKKLGPAGERFVTQKSAERRKSKNKAPTTAEREQRIKTTKLPVAEKEKLTKEHLNLL